MAHETVSSKSQIAVWDLPVRLFHWSLVAAIAVAFLSSEEDSVFAAWHMTAGWVAAVLIAFRLSWGFIGGRNARFASFVRPGALLPHLRGLFKGKAERSVGHNPLGGMAVLALLGGTAAVLWTGVPLTVVGGREDLHETIAYGLLGLIAVHVIGVIVMSVMTRDNLVRAMITGRKPAVGFPAQQAERPRALAALAGGAVVVMSVLGILRYDKSAFDGVSSEAGEYEQGEAVGTDGDHDND